MSDIFFLLVKSYSIRSNVCIAPRKSFFPAFFKVSIDHLFDNIESGKKKIIVLEQKS